MRPTRMKSLRSILRDLVEALGFVGGALIIVIVAALVTILIHPNWTSV